MQASTLGAEPGGTLNVTASESIEAIGAVGDYGSGIFAQVDERATGRGGNVTIETGQLIVRGGAQIQAVTFGEGAAGNLSLMATESVEVSDRVAEGVFSGIFAVTTSVGKAGNLTITTPQLTVQDGAVVSASSFGSGSGAAGNLTINTDRLIVRGEGNTQITATTEGEGRGGNLTVIASDLLEISGDNTLNTSTFSNATAGNLRIETGRLIVRDGALVEAATVGAGSGGILEVRASESVELSGTSPDTGERSALSTITRGTGDAGELRIETDRLIISDRAGLSVNSQGLNSGAAGNMIVEARAMLLSNGSLQAETAAGDRGNIGVRSRSIQMRRGSSITTNASNSATGGNINITTETLTALEDSDISANAEQSFGGQVRINASGIFGTSFRPSPILDTPESDITATSQRGIEFSGSVELNTPDVDPSSGLVDLPEAVVDTAGLIDRRCSNSRRQNRFVISGRGGLPPSISESLTVEQWQDAQNLTQQALVLAQEVNAADITYRWQWQLGRLLKNQGNIKQAIANYDQAVKTLQSLRYDLVALDPNVQFNFRDEVEPVYREMVDLLLQPNVTAEISQKNLVQARNIIESLQLAELENFFRSACLDAKPEQIDRVVDRSDQTAATIYPIILPNRLEIILKLPNQENIRHYVAKKSQSEVEKALEEILQYLREPDRTDDVNRLSQQVYSWLIQPMEGELEKFQIKTLVFILDGSLRNIPMSVLYDEKAKQYLLEKYAIALAPSLQLLQPKPLQRNKLNALTAGLSEKRVVENREFSTLENVNLELQRIQSEVSSNEILLNNKFTKINLENRINSTTYTVVHLATHGKFSSQIEETYILTWDQLLKVKDLDNLLRNADSKQSSNIELLVLSACETAAGDKRAALGLAGIAVRAGARSILATLWSVDDRSTAELMSKFYHELSNTNVTKAEALRRAQISLWNHPNQDWKRPYFWASYVLVGNWL